MRNWRDLLATFDEFLIDPLEFHEAGEQVVVIQRNVGRMRGMEVDEMSSVLFTLRDQPDRPDRRLRQPGRCARGRFRRLGAAPWASSAASPAAR